MTDQRVGRHVRIYEWDEVEIDETPEQVQEIKVQAADAPKKAPQQEQPKGLSGLLKRKLF